MFSLKNLTRKGLKTHVWVFGSGVTAYGLEKIVSEIYKYNSRWVRDHHLKI